MRVLLPRRVRTRAHTHRPGRRTRTPQPMRSSRVGSCGACSCVLGSTRRCRRSLPVLECFVHGVYCYDECGWCVEWFVGPAVGSRAVRAQSCCVIHDQPSMLDSVVINPAGFTSTHPCSSRVALHGATLTHRGCCAWQGVAGLCCVDRRGWEECGAVCVSGERARMTKAPLV